MKKKSFLEGVSLQVSSFLKVKNSSFVGSMFIFIWLYFKLHTSDFELSYFAMH